MTESAYDAIRVERDVITGWPVMRLTMTVEQLVTPDLMEDIGEAKAKRLMLPVMLEELSEQVRAARDLVGLE